MNLTYRGQPYKVFTFTRFSSDSVDRPRIKLIYRGQTYNPTPHSVMVSKTVISNQLTATLTYRGVPYNRTLNHPIFINSLM